MERAIITTEAFLDYVSKTTRMKLSGTRSALICFDGDQFRRLIKSIPGRKTKGLSAEVWLSDSGIVICGNFGIGAPAAVNVLEELIACGMRRFVSVGTAGATRKEIQQGRIIICQEAFRDEGTSSHYVPMQRSAKPSPEFIKDLAHWLESSNIPYKYGKAWTTDAPYRETQEKLNYFIEMGADVVEMEASALFTVAKFRNVQIGSIFIVGDSIADEEWKPAFKSRLVKNKLNETSDSLVRFLSTSPTP